MDNKYVSRKLESGDYYKGFLQLLERLTEVGTDDITYDSFSKHLQDRESNTKTYVILDTNVNKIVATGTLIVENKFIHKLSSVGHIEDIVVDEHYSGSGLGKKIVNLLSELSKSTGCYKTILNCDVKCVGFYQKCGFVEKEVEMVIYN
jgi:glucosamine-phosphate N-acetyltransferase